MESQDVVFRRPRIRQHGEDGAREGERRVYLAARRQVSDQFAQLYRQQVEELSLMSDPAGRLY